MDLWWFSVWFVKAIRITLQIKVFSQSKGNEALSQKNIKFRAQLRVFIVLQALSVMKALQMRMKTINMSSNFSVIYTATCLLKILFTQYTCASLWWQLVLNTASLWMQLALKAALATHVLNVFTGWFTPSTRLAWVLRIICQKSHNLVRLSDEYILCCDLDY